MAISSSRQNSIGKSITKQTNKQKDWQKTYYGKTESSTMNAGSTNRTYKDLSGLSPETLAMERYFLQNNTYQPTQREQNAERLKNTAYNKVQNHNPYVNARQSSLDAIIDNLLNRKPFEYNFNEDALYDIYKQQYEQQAKEAAMNAAASAAALTGGYGNSYGASAAAQAGQQYMTQLNSMIPQLQQMALERYNAEGDRLNNQYSVLNAEDEKGYNRWADEDNRLRADLEYLMNDYNTISSQDRQAYQDAFNNNLAGFQAEAALRGVDVNDQSSWQTNNTKTGGMDTIKSGSSNTVRTTTNTKEESNTNSSSSGSGGSGGGRKKSGSGSSGSGSKYKLTDDDKDYMNTAKTKMNSTSDAQAYQYLLARLDNGEISDEAFNKILKKLGIRKQGQIDVGKKSYKN